MPPPNENEMSSEGPKEDEAAPGCCDLDESPFAFLFTLFHYGGTVFETIWLEIICAGIMAAGVAVWHHHGLALDGFEFFAGNASLGAFISASYTHFLPGSFKHRLNLPTFSLLRFGRQRLSSPSWSFFGTTYPTPGTMKPD